MKRELEKMCRKCRICCGRSDSKEFIRSIRCSRYSTHLKQNKRKGSHKSDIRHGFLFHIRSRYLLFPHPQEQKEVYTDTDPDMLHPLLPYQEPPESVRYNLKKNRY